MKWFEDLPSSSPANGNGLNLCFNRHTGYGGYSDWARGARQIVIEEAKLDQNEVQTWIRLEDGSVSGQITLNSTYGTDRYPTVAKLKSTGLYNKSNQASKLLAMIRNGHKKVTKLTSQIVGLP